jgi:hypothetical protein
MGTPPTRSAEQFEYRINHGHVHGRVVGDLGMLRYRLDNAVAQVALFRKLAERSADVAEEYVGDWAALGLQVEQRVVTHGAERVRRTNWMSAELAADFDLGARVLPDTVLDELADAIIDLRVYSDSEDLVRTMLEVYGQPRHVGLLVTQPPEGW